LCSAGGKAQDDWSGECTTGKKQSPIHIHSKIKPSKGLRPIKFQNYDTTYSGTVSDEVALTLANQASGLPRVWGGAEKKDRFRFYNCHIHWGTSKYSGSEHRIGDERYAGEIHLVHYNEEYADLGAAVASGKSNALLVLGFFFKISSTDNDAWEPIFAAAAGDGAVTVKLSDLLPPSKPTDYYHYQGSLTTPGCSEVVSWYVFDKTVSLGEDQFDFLKALTVEGTPLTPNYRFTQPLNYRKIEYYKAYGKSTKRGGRGNDGGYAVKPYGGHGPKLGGYGPKPYGPKGYRQKNKYYGPSKGPFGLKGPFGHKGPFGPKGPYGRQYRF